MSNKIPVNIRRNVQSHEDPYIDQESLEENTVCKLCGSVYMSSRWYPKGHLSEKQLAAVEKHMIVCPACRKLRDRVPGGVLKISGDFIWSHYDEILNLIRNESEKAMEDNPLERIMSMETIDNEVHITTTNEKLAQKIGRALHKAYDGHVEYKWSTDNRLVRVNWSRL